MIKKFVVAMTVLCAPLLEGQSFNNCCNMNLGGQDCCCAPWYGFVGAGYAWSFKTGIKNPDPNFWDFANEGYDAHLGDAPFFTIGVGKRFCGFLGFDVAYTYFQPFHYQKFQTSPMQSTIGFTGPLRTRFFDLDHQNVMFNLNLVPENCFSLNCSCIEISPLLGIGIGVGIHHVTNFHTVAATPLFETVSLGTTTSIGEHVRRTSFAWQGTAGVRLSPNQCSPFKFDIAYRYYDGGRFQCPSRILIATAAAGQGAGFQSGRPWKGRLRANEVLLQLNYIF